METSISHTLSQTLKMYGSPFDLIASLLKTYSVSLWVLVQMMKRPPSNAPCLHSMRTIVLCDWPLDVDTGHDMSLADSVSCTNTYSFGFFKFVQTIRRK